MNTTTVFFKNGNKVELENVFDYDDDGYKSEPHMFFYDSCGKVIYSCPYDDIDSIK